MPIRAEWPLKIVRQGLRSSFLTPLQNPCSNKRTRQINEARRILPSALIFEPQASQSLIWGAPERLTVGGGGYIMWDQDFRETGLSLQNEISMK